ncbi:MAG: carbonic anhydrase [Chryseolinea sp.]
MNARERILLEARLWKVQKENLDKDYFRNFTNHVKATILWVESYGNAAQASEITNSEPDEILVHRNPGGQCRVDDAGFMAVLEAFAESNEALYVVVCGHSHCQTIRDVVAAKQRGAYVSRWTEDIHDLYEQYSMEMAPLTPRQREHKLSELNIRRQLANLASMEVIQRAWTAGRNIQLLGWYLDLHKGEIHETHTVTSRDFQKEIPAHHR